MKNLLILFFVGMMIFCSPVYAAEETILETDFSDGNITPFGTYMDSDAYYEILNPAQDPLGTGEYVLKIVAPSSSAGHSLLTYTTQDAYGTARFVTNFMTPRAEDSDLAQIVVMDNTESGSGSSILTLRVYHSQWRIDYFNSGSSEREYFGSVEANRKYKVEVKLLIGNGNGEINVLIDDSLLFNKSGLVNWQYGGVDKWWIGWGWNADSLDEYFYDIGVYGDIFGGITSSVLQARVVDNSGNPIQNVGVRIGDDTPADKPWQTGTYYVNTYTDSNGQFSAEVPDGNIPEIKLIKPGYGNSTYHVGSITKIRNVYINGNTDLGDIILQPRTPIQASPVSQGTYWPVRAMVVWPFAKNWGSDGMAEQLQDIINKELDFNYIDLRWKTGWEGYDIVSGIDLAHEMGFGVLLTLVFEEDADFATIKQRILDRLEVAAEHDVEFICLGWEQWVYDDGSRNNDWQEILDDVNIYISEQDVNPGWDPLIGYAATAPNNDAESMDQLYDNIWFRNLDFLIILNWNRLSSARSAAEGGVVHDPTEEDITACWHMGHAYWEGSYVDKPIFYEEYRTWLKQAGPDTMLVINLGAVIGDGSLWRPFGYSETVQDQEEQALFWKVTFEVFQDIEIDGFSMEHYSFDPSETAVTGNVRGALAEDFIKFGVDAHAVQTSGNVIGRLVDKNNNPINAIIVIYDQSGNVINTKDTDSYGNYNLALAAGTYDIKYDIANFFLPDIFIKMLSMDIESAPRNMLMSATEYPSDNKVSFILNSTGTQEIQIYSGYRPDDIKINGTTVPYNETLSTAPSWNYNESTKTATVIYNMS